LIHFLFITWDGALNSITMGVKWGGKQDTMRDADDLDEHCLGNEPAFTWHNAEKAKWPLTEVDGHAQIGCRVHVGDVQSASFAVGAPPPFYDLDAKPRPHEVLKNASAVKMDTTISEDFGEGGVHEGTITAFTPGSGWCRVGCRDGDKEDLRWAELAALVPKSALLSSTTRPVSKPGHVGAPKGMKQHLWERGLYFDRGENGACKLASCLSKGKGCPMMEKVGKGDEHFRPHDFSMRRVLGQCRDFSNETSALEEKHKVLGMMLIMSPKGHPELAGKGIKFSWGVSKKHFRKINNCVGKDLHKNILKLFTVLDLAQSRRNSRRTRRYRGACDTSRAACVSHDCHLSVEKCVSAHKCHRNMLDQETKYVKDVLAKHNVFVE
jgi:hypothetical protein